MIGIALCLKLNAVIDIQRDLLSTDEMAVNVANGTFLCTIQKNVRISACSRCPVVADTNEKSCRSILHGICTQLERSSIGGNILLGQSGLARSRCAESIQRKGVGLPIRRLRGKRCVQRKQAGGKDKTTLQGIVFHEHSPGII